MLHKGREMVISSLDIPLQEEIRYFPSKAYGGNTRKVFADHFGRILLHTQQKQLSESDLPEWLMLASRTCSHNYFRSHSSFNKTARFFEKHEKTHEKSDKRNSWLAFL